MTSEDRWLPIKEAAAAVGVSDATVRRYIRNGAVKLRLRLVRLSEVQGAERDARRRKESGLKNGGARGDWLATKAEEFIASRRGNDGARGIVEEFIAYARA